MGNHMMAVRVDLNPILRRQYQIVYNPETGLILENGAGKTLRQIIQELGLPIEEITSTLVNHRVEQPGYKVQDGDSIYLSIAISGGC
jgi:hypothetical protein